MGQLHYSKEANNEPGQQGIRQLVPYLSLLKGQTWPLVATFSLMILSSGLALAMPMMAGKLVDSLGSKDIESPDHEVRGIYFAAVAVLLVGQLIASFAYSIVSTRLGLQTVTRLRQKVYSHLLELPALFFSRQKVGDISSRVTSDVGSIQSLLTGGLIGFLRAVFMLCGAIILMVKLNGRLSLAVLLLIPATILLTRFFGDRMRKLSRTLYQDFGKITSHVQETVGGIRNLKVYNAQTYESNRFQELTNGYRDAGISRVWLSSAFESGIQLSMWTCLLASVIYGFTLMNTGQITSGDLVAFLLLALRVGGPLSSLTGLFSQAQGAIAAADRLNDIFSISPEREPETPAPAPNSSPPSLALENVSFAYPESETKVLDSLSIEIERGQLVGLVGPSGGGKTTLAGLILGLFPPTEGRLLLDHQPYEQYDLSDLRSRMAWVAQDPVIYDLSLAENIRFGLSSATDEQVQRAAEKAQVMEFAAELPEGLDSFCGERGGRLSGGQKQRIALARAFLRNPGLLVLDEPTSALDAASEDAVRLAMRKLMAGRTAVVIAHRFSLVKDLDLILVMNRGRIVQQGNHKELMAEGGLYRTLFELQQGEETGRPRNQDGPE